MKCVYMSHVVFIFLSFFRVSIYFNLTFGLLAIYLYIFTFKFSGFYRIYNTILTHNSLYSNNTILLYVKAFHVAFLSFCSTI